MKHLLLTTIAAVVLVGCGPSVDIHQAAEAGNITVVKYHLDAGVNVNVEDNFFNRTPLHHAAIEDQKEIVELLIDNSADVNAKDVNGYTPLDWAITFMHPELADVLQQHGAKHGSIRNAVEFGNIEALKEFLDAGADVNEGKSRGDLTPLHYAALRGHKEITELLIAKGAGLNAKYVGGETPLHYAAQYDHTEIAELLISKGADLNVRTRDGQTLLHRTALYNHTATAELLIAHGVDVNAKANNGRTSLHFASEKSHKEIAKLLIKKGVDVNAKRNDSATPLDEADDEETIALLRKHGGKTGEELKAEGK